MSNNTNVELVNSYTNGMIHSKRAVPGTPLYALLEQIKEGAYRVCYEWVDMRGKTKRRVFAYVDSDWRCHHVDDRTFARVSTVLAGRGKFTWKSKQDIEFGS